MTDQPKPSAMKRLLRNDTDIDFVGRTRLWLTISLVLMSISLLSLVTRQLNLGIDFEGGAVFEVECNPGQHLTEATARDAITPLGQNQAKVQTVSSPGSDTCLRVQTKTLDPAKSEDMRAALAKAAHVDVNKVNAQAVGPSWGDAITKKAERALALFLLVITVYITIRFEFLMAVPTLVALLHDILLTVGVYSLFQIEVTPATVVAVLTILGYSIYDGIVVFDKVDENVKLVTVQNKMTYSDMVNLSLNQTLMRSINTTLTAVLPILSLLVVGSFILGATTLQEFGFALLIGLASGAYSSIFVASPLLAIFKERDPKVRELRRKLEGRQAAGAGSSRTKAPARAGVAVAAADGPTSDQLEGDRPGDDDEATESAAKPATKVAVTGAPGPASTGWSSNRPPKPRKKGRTR